MQIMTSLYLLGCILAHLFRWPNLDNISQEDTEVNVRTRWETIEQKMIASGFCDGKSCFGGEVGLPIAKILNP